jgi:small acid-soluble spore protein H (minor)
MSYERVKEILASPTTIDVTYNNIKIYIEDVDETNKTANIHYLNHPDYTLEVPINSLSEH